jgi:nucleoside-triphosphatase THEP1
MRKTLEDLYYGNITPCEQQMTPDSELKRAVERVAKCEEQLLALLDEESQHILVRLTRSQHEINGITATENFILGFRLGIRLMAECMDDNDGDIQTGGE